MKQLPRLSLVGLTSSSSHPIRDETEYFPANVQFGRRIIFTYYMVSTDTCLVWVCLHKDVLFCVRRIVKMQIKNKTILQAFKYLLLQRSYFPERTSVACTHYYFGWLLVTTGKLLEKFIFTYWPNYPHVLYVINATTTELMGPLLMKPAVSFYIKFKGKKLCNTENSSKNTRDFILIGMRPPCCYHHDSNDVA